MRGWPLPRAEGVTTRTGKQVYPGQNLANTGAGTPAGDAFCVRDGELVVLEVKAELSETGWSQANVLESLCGPNRQIVADELLKLTDIVSVAVE